MLKKKHKRIDKLYITMVYKYILIVYEMNAIQALLSSKVRIEVLKNLTISPDESYNINELSRKTGFAVRGVEKELKNLLAGGILKKRIIGNQHQYQINPDCPIYAEIKNMIVKTVGIKDVVEKSLKPLEEKIDYAFIYGSFASGEFSAESDVDLFVVSDVSGLELTKIITGIQETINRTVNLAHFSQDEFKRRRKEKDHFVMNVITGSIINIIGRADEP
jgi:predicted nucleotidyltransferase